MKKKDFKDIVKKIAHYEKVIQSSDDERAVEDAKMQIMSLTNEITSLEDLDKIDELVSEILDNK